MKFSVSFKNSLSVVEQEAVPRPLTAEKVGLAFPCFCSLDEQEVARIMQVCGTRFVSLNPLNREEELKKAKVFSMFWSEAFLRDKSCRMNYVQALHYKIPYMEAYYWVRK